MKVSTIQAQAVREPWLTKVQNVGTALLFAVIASLVASAPTTGDFAIPERPIAPLRCEGAHSVYRACKENTYCLPNGELKTRDPQCAQKCSCAEGEFQFNGGIKRAAGEYVDV